MLHPQHRKLHPQHRKLYPRHRKLYPQHRKLHPQHRKLHPQHRKLYPQHRKLYPHHRKLYPQHRKLHPQHRKLHPQHRKLYPQHRKLHPQHRKLHPQHRKLYPQHRKLYPQHRKLYTQHRKLYPQHRKLYPQHRKLHPQHRKLHPQHRKLYPQHRKLSLRSILPFLSVTTGNAACREEAMSGQLVCQCAVGYRRSGEDCVSVNPCLQKPCHAKATCSHTGPNKYICACAAGYAGDGHVCLAVDPCQTDQAGCSAQTTKCVYDGPGALDSRLTCRLQDVCKPDSCHEKANCSTVQPGVTECTCPEGYLGDGKVCYGNIMQRMRDLNTEPGGQWTGQLTAAITLFGTLRRAAWRRAVSLETIQIFKLAFHSGYLFGSNPTRTSGSLSWALQTLGPFTVFVPINSGFRFTSVKTLMADPLKAKYLCKLHMAAGTMPQDDLKRADVYYTLTGKAGEVDTSGFVRQRRYGT
ncbi:Stabilin-2 [Merluccius polli]|uniref:Stabilin-2 n=1 Tax=Merluccius polli TaxID=89951 RepID=A0AA47NPU0_MERPO|nr:Stabilin-2 [Merluccius polli]